jgi:hypothetical protein
LTPKSVQKKFAPVEKVLRRAYVFSVVAAILADVEDGICGREAASPRSSSDFPPGKNARFFGDLQIAGRFACSAGQDARL